MQKGSNLTTFLQLVNAKSRADSQLPLTRLDEAEVYVEFAYLRDYWHSLEHDNDAKRRFIFDLFSRVGRLRHYENDSFPSVIGEFNRTFMGSPGTRIRNDIVYPGRWSVTGLFERFRARRDEFGDFCRFKWSFNIKPDIVVLLPGSKPLCIEAKFESKEGRYPTSSSDCAAFDAAFGKEQGRVGQIELQQFMFRALLNDPCQSVFIGAAPEVSDVPFLAWREVFSELDLTSSIDYVTRLIEENRHLVA